MNTAKRSKVLILGTSAVEEELATSFRRLGYEVQVGTFEQGAPGAMTPDKPQDPQKGKAGEGAVPEDAKEAKAADKKSAEQPEAKPKRTRAKKAAPEAEGQAAEATGVDKAAAEATEEKPKPKRRKLIAATGDDE